MRIRKMKLKNFRIFKDETIIDFDNLTAFIGKNDIGKSTILEALEIFFNGREKDTQVKLDKEDVNKDAKSSEIVIDVVFDHYPDKMVLDSSVKTSLKEEFLLNEEGLLEIKKVFPNGDIRKEKTFIVAHHPINEELRDLLTFKITDLRKRASDLGIDLSDEDRRVSSAIRKAIRNNFKGIRFGEVEIPVDKEDAKRIWDRVRNYLPLYALFKADRTNIDQDTEIQDPMKLAIRRIMREDELQEKLTYIKDRVEKEVTEIANKTIEKLNEMNPEVAKELKPHIPEPKWENMFKGITIKSDKDIPLNKRGSGVRRLVLLNFFRAEAENKKNEKNAPDIIYAFEEPEISQHPEYQKKLVEALLELSRRDGIQIILTTHSPGIANLLPTDSLRFLHKEDDRVVIEKGTDDEVLEKIAESLGVLSYMDIDKLKVVILVEGPRDVEFFKRVGKIIDKDLTIDFENDPRVLIVPLGGSNLKHWVQKNYLRKLNLPEIHIYDGDIKDYKKTAEANSTDGRKIFIAKNREIENYVHPKVIEDIFRELTKNSIIDRTNPNWPVEWSKVDVPKIVRENGVPMKEERIKDKICTVGAEKMTVELFKEMQVYEEIKEWFKSIKDVMAQ